MSARTHLFAVPCALAAGCSLFLGLDDKTYDVQGAGGATTSSVISASGATSSAAGGGGASSGSTLWVLQGKSDQTVTPAVAPAGVCVDPSGDIWITGWFAGNISFPMVHAYSATPGTTASFVLHLSPDGEYVADALLTAGEMMGNMVETQAILCEAGGAIVSGQYTGRFNEIDSQGISGFVLRIRPDGTPAWHAEIVGSGMFAAIGTLARGLGSALVFGGQAEGDITFGMKTTGSPMPFGYVGAVDEPSTVAKYLKVVSTPGTSSVRAVDADATSIAVTGEATAPASLSGCDIMTTGDSAYVALLDDGGNCTKATVNSVTHMAWQAGIAVRLLSSAVVVGGSFTDRLELDPEPPLAASDPSDTDAFLATLSRPSLAATAVAQLGMTGANGTIAFVNSIAIDPLGGVAISASATGNAEFFGVKAASKGGYDALVAHVKADLSGVDWARRIGGSSNDFGHSVAVTPDGDVVAIGGFGDTVDFGTGPLVATGTTDIYVMKLAR